MKKGETHNMDFLTKDQILKAQDTKFEDVDMTEFGWKGKVRVAVMSGMARDNFELDIFGEDGSTRNFQNLRAKLLAATIVDPFGGKPLFETEKDVKSLGLKSSKALDHLFEIARRINGVLTDSEIDKKAKT
jgi:hypothetical protein